MVGLPPPWQWSSATCSWLWLMIDPTLLIQPTRDEMNATLQMPVSHAHGKGSSQQAAVLIRVGDDFEESSCPSAQWGQKAWALSYMCFNPKLPCASVPPWSQRGDNFCSSALLQCLIFSLITHLSLPPFAGYGQSKGSCDGYCSYMCAKRDEWTFSRSCGKMYCCIPPPKKGK